MAFDAKAKFVGLVTATAESTGEPGGLRIADNVTLRKEGALVCRPSFSSSVLARSYLASFSYKGSPYYVGPGNVYYTWGQVALTGATTPAVRDDVQSVKEARNNLYFASSVGIFKITGTAVSALYPAGVKPTAALFYPSGQDTTGTDHLLTVGQQVAYRIVTVKTDVNGLIVRSRPSGATVVVGNASPGSPVILIYAGSPSVQDAITKSRVVEIYRSRVFPAGVQVDDELQLVHTLTMPANGATVSVTDRVPDIRRGTTLYTSPSRGGSENAADCPPGAACIERFRGSLFFGNTTGPHRVVISYKWAGQRNGLATGIGQRVTTGNVTNGSAAITSVANVTGIQAGMYCALSVAGGAYGKVLSVVGSTVTVATAATATSAGVTLYFTDALTIDAGSPFMYGSVAPPYGTNWPNITTSLNLALQGPGSTYTAYEITPPVAGYDQTTVIERSARGGVAFQLRASRGDEVSPPVPLGDAATGLESTADILPNGLAWSEPDEPEHVPPKNFARVGDAGKAILGLVATRDRLLIFKEDGLYMLTGDTAANFSISPLDTTCLCILPGSIRRLQNTVYVLTNLGLVAVDESGGVTVVSRPIQNEVATIVNAIRAAQKASGLYLMPGLSGVTGAGDDANGEYWLALGSSTPSFGGHALIYSLPRNGFTTYTFTSTPVALSTDGEGNPLVLTATALFTPTTTPGVVAARVQPRGFCDPALLTKFWTHVIAGFSQLTGTASVSARFTSSTAMVSTPIVTEAFEVPLDGSSLIQLPNGSLLRHPTPTAVRRAYTLLVELLINVTNGTFTLDMVGAESRENASNKEPTIGTGAT